MLSALKTISILLTMLGGIVALFGDAREKEESTQRSHFTLVGWASVTLIMLGGVCTYFIGFAEKAEIERQARLDYRWSVPRQRL